MAMHDRGDSYRVGYLGSSMLTKATTGIGALQKPLQQLYFPFVKLGKKANLQERLLTMSNQEMTMGYQETPNGHSQAERVSISNMVMWDCVQFVTVKSKKLSGAFEPLDNDHSRNKDNLFVVLDKKLDYLHGKQHSAVFTCVIRRSSGVKALDIHAFICQSPDEALSIVHALNRLQLEYTSGENEQSGVFGYNPFKDSVRSVAAVTSQAVIKSSVRGKQLPITPQSTAESGAQPKAFYHPSPQVRSPVLSSDEGSSRDNTLDSQSSISRVLVLSQDHFSNERKLKDTKRVSKSHGNLLQSVGINKDNLTVSSGENIGGSFDRATDKQSPSKQKKTKASPLSSKPPASPSKTDFSPNPIKPSAVKKQARVAPHSKSTDNLALLNKSGSQDKNKSKNKESSKQTDKLGQGYSLLSGSHGPLPGYNPPRYAEGSGSPIPGYVREAHQYYEEQNHLHHHGYNHYGSTPQLNEDRPVPRQYIHHDDHHPYPPPQHYGGQGPPGPQYRPQHPYDRPGSPGEFYQPERQRQYQDQRQHPEPRHYPDPRQQPEPHHYPDPRQHQPDPRQHQPDPRQHQDHPQYPDPRQIAYRQTGREEYNIHDDDEYFEQVPTGLRPPPTPNAQRVFPPGEIPQRRPVSPPRSPSSELELETTHAPKHQLRPPKDPGYLDKPPVYITRQRKDSHNSDSSAGGGGVGMPAPSFGAPREDPNRDYHPHPRPVAMVPPHMRTGGVRVLPSGAPLMSRGIMDSPSPMDRSKSSHFNKSYENLNQGYAPKRSQSQPFEEQNFRGDSDHSIPRAKRGYENNWKMKTNIGDESPELKSKFYGEDENMRDKLLLNKKKDAEIASLMGSLHFDPNREQRTLTPGAPRGMNFEKSLGYFP